jgi:hypothetical protein
VGLLAAEERASRRASIRDTFENMKAAMALWLAAVVSPAAELAVERVTTQPGKKIAAQVKFKAEGAAVTALQFDVEYNPAAMTVGGALGPAAEAASKRITITDAAPNRKRVLLWGLNHNNLEDGAVVALTLEVKADASAGDYPLRLQSAGASNSAGSPLALRTVDGNVAVNSNATQD